MSFLKKLFGGGTDAPSEKAKTETYKEYRITPTPISEGGQYRISAHIEKDFDGETRSHTLIRAETLPGLEAAQTASLNKARQAIDSLGDGIFK